MSDLHLLFGASFGMFSLLLSHIEPLHKQGACIQKEFNEYPA